MSRESSKNYTNLSVREAHECIQRGECLLFDVRTPEEYASHHIAGAKLLPIQELNERHPEIPRNSPTPVLIICEHGIRSAHAARALAEAGWENIVNVSGGMAEWMEEGLPVVRE